MKKPLHRKGRKKTWAVFHRFTALFILYSIGILSPADMHASMQQRITLGMKHATIEEVIAQVREMTDYRFSFRQNDIPAVPKRDYSFNDDTIDIVLNALLEGTSLEWNEINGTIVISRKTVHEQSQQQPQQSFPASITGRVTDAAGRPLTGVSVQLKGHALVAASTDTNGNFTLRFPDPAAAAAGIIVFSYVGMQTQEIKVDGRERHDITLRPAVYEIEEVVITTGYQEIPRDRMTGASTTITAKDIENSAFMTIDAVLDGKVAGLYSAAASGSPGAKSELRIRGDNSISGNQEPLWVVDGLPLQTGVMSIEGITAGNVQQSILDHGIGTLSPSDIESVTILKDAAATAIYGARAANGVIVVKTKQGADGPLTVNYQANFGITSSPKMSAYNFMNAEQKIALETELMEEFMVAGGVGSAGRLWLDWKRNAISTEEYNRQLDEWRKVNVNWFDEIYQTSFVHNHNLSIRGGTQKFWFYASLNATDEKGALVTNRYNQFGTNANIGFRPANAFTVDLRVSGSYRETNDHASAINPFVYAIFANPYEKPYNDDGSYAWDNSYLQNNISALHSGYKYSEFNILREMEQTYRKNIASDVSATLSLNWMINGDLKVEVHGRVGYSTNSGETAAGRGTYTSLTNYFSLAPFRTNDATAVVELPAEYNKGFIRVTSGRAPSFSFRSGLSYNKTLDSKHFITAYVGTEASSQEAWNSSFRTAQYDMDFFFAGFPQYSWVSDFDSDFAADINRMTSYLYGGKDRTVSIFGAFTYSYRDRYVLNANIRMDGAGTIDPSNRFIPLWSASARWNLHKEKFVAENFSFISEFAIRMVYGYTGNIDRSALPYPYIILSSQEYDNEYIAGRINFPQPNIKWERKQDRSIGIDYSLFKNTFGGSFNYYSNRTDNVLGRTTAPNSSLNTRPIMNTHSISNKGIEFIFNLRLRFNELTWNTQFNISHNKNKITRSTYPSLTDFTSNTQVNYWAGYSGPVEGYENNATFGYRFAGVDPNTGNALIYLSEEARRIYANARGIDIADAPTTWDTEASNSPISGLGINDWVMLSLGMIGKMQPDYTGGFTTTLGWKGIELRAGFSYATGHLVRSFDERSNSYSPISSNNDLQVSQLNRQVILQNRWRSPGDVTNYPRITTSTGGSRYILMLTDDKFEKGDFLNFKDISLNYNLKTRFFDDIGIKYCRLGFQVQNVHVWSEFRSTDATTRNAFGYPHTRKYLLNIQLSF